MKKRSQLSAQNLKNHKIFEKNIVIFDTSYLLRIISISIITTLILIIFWQFTKLISQQQLNTKNQVKSTKTTIKSSNNLGASHFLTKHKYLNQGIDSGKYSEASIFGIHSWDSTVRQQF